MDPQASVPRPRVSDAVHDHLRAAILSGRLAPGDAVPSERELSETLSVNRHAVREALKRLQQSGLVLIAQGGATRVRDWRSHGGLELLLDLPLAEGIDPAVMRAILEMRASIGADAARRCAERAPAPRRRNVAELAELVADTEDAEAREHEHERLWELIVEGSENIAYRLAFNTLVLGLVRVPDVARELTPRQDESAQLRALGAAMLAADGAAAAAAVLPMLERPLAPVRRGRQPH